MTEHNCLQELRATGYWCIPPLSEEKNVNTTGETFTNDQRSENADQTLRAYMKLTACDGDDAIVDILSDLMHWCDRNEYDFWNATDLAHAHYVSEVEAEH